MVETRTVAIPKKRRGLKKTGQVRLDFGILKYELLLQPSNNYHYTQHNYTHLNDTEYNDTQYNDTQYNDTQYNDTQYEFVQNLFKICSKWGGCVGLKVKIGPF